jgi:hypothetical protein
MRRPSVNDAQMLTQAETSRISEFVGTLAVVEFGQIALPTTVYHYTDATGVYGISDSGKIWASNLAFLNDKMEFEHAVGLLLDRLEFLLKGKLTKEAHDWAELVADRVKKRRFGIEPEYFVACFSEARDDLSQWRAYGSNGSGVALGLNTIRLAERTRQMDGEFLPVVYDSDRQVRLLDTALNWAAIEMPHVVASSNQDQLEARIEAWNEAFFGKIERFAPFMKDRAFAGEKEWRAVFRVVQLGDIFFRPKKDHLVPYLPADLGVEANYTPEQLQWIRDQKLASYLELDAQEPIRKLPITEVVVGPGDRDIISYRSLRRYLWRNGYLGLEMKFSEIPYRSMD